MWYFTSPVKSSSVSGCVLPAPAKPAMIIWYGFSSTWVRTLSRPRWAMPMTTSCAPAAAASLITVSSTGTIASVPSREKRFWPKKALCRYFSKPSTWERRRSVAFCSSGERGAWKRPDSTASRSHSRSSASMMCSNS
jgi:hypothetical protein